MTLVKWKSPISNGQTAKPVLFDSPFTGIIDHFLRNDFFGEHALFMPPVNLSEEPDRFLIELSAPGFVKSDFTIEVTDGTLSVWGAHKEEKDLKEENYSRKEFTCGAFQRSFALPQGIRKDGVSAKYESGILKIELPKNKEDKNKSVIKVD